MKNPDSNLYPAIILGVRLSPAIGGPAEPGRWRGVKHPALVARPSRINAGEPNYLGAQTRNFALLNLAPPNTDVQVPDPFSPAVPDMDGYQSGSVPQTVVIIDNGRFLLRRFEPFKVQSLGFSKRSYRISTGV